MNSSHKIKTRRFLSIAILILLLITSNANATTISNPFLLGLNHTQTSHEPFPIDTPAISLDDYFICASDRIGADPKTRLTCLTSKKKNEVILAVIKGDGNEINTTLLTTKPILSYQQFIERKAQIRFDPDTLHTYFSFASDHLEIYLLCYEKAPGSFAVRRGEYTTDREIITFAVEDETNDYIVVAPLIYPQIKWPCDTDKLDMNNFDFSDILAIGRDALKYLDHYTDTHLYEDDSETLYEIIW